MKPTTLLPLVSTLAIASLLLLVSGSASAAEPGATAALPPTVGIVTPSGNISCASFVSGPTASMRCLIHRTAGGDLPRPQGLEGCDWTGGRWFALDRRGPGSRFAPCDALADPSPQRLAYGSAWRNGPFRCLSTRLALLCTNSNGHGMFLSRELQRVF
ncbi:MAG: hypothetical protein ACXWXY_10640 [Aeromicrobium sp.]